MLIKREDVFFNYAHFGDIRSTQDTTIIFELLFEVLKRFNMCGMSLVNKTQVCWYFGYYKI